MCLRVDKRVCGLILSLFKSSQESATIMGVVDHMSLLDPGWRSLDSPSITEYCCASFQSTSLV